MHKIYKEKSKNNYYTKTRNSKLLSNKINISKESWLPSEMTFYQIGIKVYPSRENKRIGRVFKITNKIILMGLYKGIIIGNMIKIIDKEIGHKDIVNLRRWDHNLYKDIKEMTTDQSLW